MDILEGVSCKTLQILYTKTTAHVALSGSCAIIKAELARQTGKLGGGPITLFVMYRKLALGKAPINHETVIDIITGVLRTCLVAPNDMRSKVDRTPLVAFKKK